MTELRDQAMVLLRTEVRRLVTDRDRLESRLRAIRAAETGVKRRAFRSYALAVANLDLPGD